MDAASDLVGGRLSNSDIRQANTTAVCRLIRSHPRLTRAEVVEATGLARPTVVAILQQLMADGFVVEADLRRSASGRPASVLQFRPEARVIASVRLSQGSHIEAVLADMTGAVLATSLRPRPAASAPWQDTVGAFVDHVADLRDAHPELGPLAAVAACLPGTVRRDQGLWTMPRRRGWTDIPVVETMSAALGVPVGIVNVAASSLIGRLASEQVSASSAVLVYLGRGIGAAASMGGRLIDGVGGSAGELGHCVLPGVDRRCRCGQTGCLEAVTATPFLWEEYRRITGRRGRPTLREMEQSGDGDVLEMLRLAARRLALGASWMVNIIDPAMLYLGGNAFTDGGEFFFSEFVAGVKDAAFGPNLADATVSAAPSESLLAGAVQVAAELLPEPLRPALRLIS